MRRGMLHVVIEEGPETFTQRWRRYAADAVLFARPEGSPLLEAEVAGTVVQLLERTNPYLGVPGAARLVVQANAETMEACAADAVPSLEVPARGTLRGRGPVLEREGRLVVLDVGAPILVALPEGEAALDPRPGDRLQFEARAPIHGFVLPPASRSPAAGNGRGIDDAP